MSLVKQIGVAIVEHNGRYLIGIRNPESPLAGYAEFPGGKCLAGECPSDCAIRECMEESGLAVVSERLLQQRKFDYPHGSVELNFILCHPATGNDVSDRHNEFWWETADRLKNLKFPEGNSDVIKLLK